MGDNSGYRHRNIEEDDSVDAEVYSGDHKSGGHNSFLEKEDSTKERSNVAADDACMRMTKGGSKRVRFQPRSGKFLATATGNGINIVEIEVDSILRNLKGHVKDILSICWDRSGKYIGYVSEDSARIWPLYGECIQENFPNFPLEDKVVLLGGGIDRVGIG
ncbi:PREDICTED: transcriptional corepressor LEUNIG-like [Lupinus angustifolius]|uniref:transcriptional corepressor LEUNIG-like n=1 Tax=Lupinus angustifolius TaxID=3871 RepID=UPI00092F4B87|nr:PREDICTED: transcriptional corepressor LEUNIG-like [Lupinus angustifolius]